MNTTPNPTIECVVASRDQLGETPLWYERTHKLWWIDIESPRIQSYDPETGHHETYAVGRCISQQLANSSPMSNCTPSLWPDRCSPSTV